MKFLLLIIVFSAASFADVKLHDKKFQEAVVSCGGSIKKPKTTKISDSMIKDCVKKSVDPSLHETVEFWKPKYSILTNDSHYKCRGHLGRVGMHGEDSGEFEACVKQQNCYYPNGVDHIGLSAAPCVSYDEIGMGESGKVNTDEKPKKIQPDPESKKAEVPGVQQK